MTSLHLKQKYATIRNGWCWWDWGNFIPAVIFGIAAIGNFTYARYADALASAVSGIAVLTSMTMLTYYRAELIQRYRQNVQELFKNS